MKQICIILSIALISFASCKKDKDEAGIYKGPETQIFNGKASTWLILNKSGNPEQAGIRLTNEVMNIGPARSPFHGFADNSDGISWTLEFNSKADVTPFTHVVMIWNLPFHEPLDIYTQQHFNFHFYMISEADRLSIPAYDQAPQKFDNDPHPEYLPAHYFNGGSGIKQQGAYWSDNGSPESEGDLFTQTFMYGSYDGKVTFYDFMISLQFLKENDNFSRSIPQPQKFANSGFYPTILRVVKHDGFTELILDGFTYRLAS